MENLNEMHDEFIYFNEDHSVWARVLVRNKNMVTFELRDSKSVLDVGMNPLLLQDAIAMFKEIYPSQEPKSLLYQHPCYVIYLYGKCS